MLQHLIELVALRGYGLHFQNWPMTKGFQISLTSEVNGTLHKTIKSKMIPWDHYNERYITEVVRFLLDGNGLSHPNVDMIQT